MAYVQHRIHFDHNKDRDILELKDSMTTNAFNRRIKDLLRQDMKRTRSSQLDTIENMLRGIKTLLDAGVVVKGDDDNLRISDNIDDSALAEIENNLSSLGV